MIGRYRLQYEPGCTPRADRDPEHEAPRVGAQRHVAGASGSATDRVHDPRGQARACQAQGRQVSPFGCQKNLIYGEYRRVREGARSQAEPADEEYQWRSAIESQRVRWRGDEQKTLWETSSTQLEGIRERKDETAKVVDGCVTRRYRRGW